MCCHEFVAEICFLTWIRSSTLCISVYVSSYIAENSPCMLLPWVPILLIIYIQDTLKICEKSKFIILHS